MITEKISLTQFRCPECGRLLCKVEVGAYVEAKCTRCKAIICFDKDRVVIRKLRDKKAN